MRPSRDGRAFKFYIDYVNVDGKRRRVSLGHADRSKAERQRAQKERELRMGVVVPESMRLSDFLEDSLSRTGNQIRESTHDECRGAMNDFIDLVGNIDYQRITLKHGELFRQKCLDKGNAPATVARKLRHIKRLFQLAVNRRQLDENPLKCINPPKLPKKNVNIFSADECESLVKAAGEYEKDKPLRWGLLIITALTTGMRRGELFNATWQDIDFEKNTIGINPKKNTDETWEWLIKYADHRKLPLTEELVSLLTEHHNRQPERYPYVFVPCHRYNRVQQLRHEGNWTLCSSRQNLIHNFTRQFRIVLKRAGIKRPAQFHDLRRTALSNWLANGMGEYEVMVLAGHANFNTTHEFYLAVSEDLMDRARRISTKSFGQNLARAWHTSTFLSEKV